MSLKHQVLLLNSKFLLMDLP